MNDFSKFEQDPALIELIKQSGSLNKSDAFAAQQQLALAVQTPLREAVLVGDIVRGLYFPERYQPGVNPEYPIDVIAPGEEDDFMAVTNPGMGHIPEHAVEGDYVTIHTYGIQNSVDWSLRVARNGGLAVVRRAFQAFQAGFVQKLNDDGMHTLIAAGVDRNIVVYDADAANGFFTKRLVSLMKTTMSRNAGGNAASLNRGRLTDILLSVDAIEDIRNWGVDQVDDITRHNIYMSGDNGSDVTRIFQVNLHGLTELGEGMRYQNFFENQLAATMPTGDVEIVIGVDVANAADSFVMAIREEIAVYPNDGLHHQQRAGLYGWGEFGFGVLDTRRCLIGSM